MQARGARAKAVRLFPRPVPRKRPAAGKEWDSPARPCGGERLLGECTTEAGLPPAEQPEAAVATNVVNLMDALRRSIDAEKPAARPKGADRKKPAKQPERRPAKAARRAS
jgi:hypothetical protein